jgi:hypothetical protein
MTSFLSRRSAERSPLAVISVRPSPLRLTVLINAVRSVVRLLSESVAVSSAPASTTLGTFGNSDVHQMVQGLSCCAYAQTAYATLVKFFDAQPFGAEEDLKVFRVLSDSFHVLFLSFVYS